MANSDSAHLEALKTARDAIVAGIAEGRLTIDIMIRGRRHTVESPTEALKQIEESIRIYEGKEARSTRRTFRLVSLQGPRGRDG